MARMWAWLPLVLGMPRAYGRTASSALSSGLWGGVCCSFVFTLALSNWFNLLPTNILERRWSLTSLRWRLVRFTSADSSEGVTFDANNVG